MDQRVQLIGDYQRPPARQHLEQDDAERPDVRALVDRLPARLLGTHVGGRTQNHPGLRHGGASWQGPPEGGRHLGCRHHAGGEQARPAPVMVQLAWSWVRYRPSSALAQCRQPKISVVSTHAPIGPIARRCWRRVTGGFRQKGPCAGLVRREALIIVSRRSARRPSEGRRESPADGLR